MDGNGQNTERSLMRFQVPCCSFKKQAPAVFWCSIKEGYLLTLKCHPFSTCSLCEASLPPHIPTNNQTATD